MFLSLEDTSEIFISNGELPATYLNSTEKPTERDIGRVMEQKEKKKRRRKKKVSVAKC